MFQRVYELASDPNFRPFVIVLHSGTRYGVRTRDHIFFIRDDEGHPVETWFEVVTGARAFNVPPEAVSSIELEPVKQIQPGGAGVCQGGNRDELAAPRVLV